MFAESAILGFGMRNSAPGIWNPANDWNPESKFRWQDRLRGRRFKGKGKGALGKRVLGARETRGARGRREGNACQETIVFLVFNIYQANVKILIGQNLIRSK